MSARHSDNDDHDDHDDFGGIRRDMPGLLGRRRALQVLGGASLVGLVAACSSSGNTTSGTTATTSGTTATSAASGAAGGGTSSSAPATTSPAATAAEVVESSPGPEIPDETQGPFPADGSNGPNLLDTDGVVRADITGSIGELSGTAEGVPLTIALTVVDAATGSPLPGAAVYLWHCTADGRYSIYEIDDQNYLRGIQVADAAGRLSFTTVFPGCYPGRWPHAHFEVYDTIDQATAGSDVRKTSQLALPEADCVAVYADARYGNSSSSLDRLSLDTDGVFRDGWTDQLTTVAGSNDAGYTASLLVRV